MSSSKPAGKKGAHKKKRAGKKSTTAAKKKTATKVNTGAVQQVWDICASMQTAITNGTKSRKDVIEKCVSDGINKSTAATQYQKWKTATYK